MDKEREEKEKAEFAQWPQYSKPKPESEKKYWVRCACGGNMALINPAPPKFCSQCGKRLVFPHAAGKRVKSILG